MGLGGLKMMMGERQDAAHPGWEGHLRHEMGG